jgi:hypothetical protein
MKHYLWPNIAFLTASNRKYTLVVLAGLSLSIQRITVEELHFPFRSAH